MRPKLPADLHPHTRALITQARRQGATGVCRRLKTKLRGLKELTIDAVMACATEAARETVQP